MPRALEVPIAVLLLLLAAPLLLLAGLLVRCESPGPIIYRQRRIGRDGRPFTLLKLRTMVTDADRSGQLTLGNADPRTTHCGRLLRRSKLDELPQLVNVIRGEMALVGPRPEVPEYVDPGRPDQAVVLAHRPGLTDPASLAFRDEAQLLANRADPERYYREVILPTKLAISANYLRHRNTRSDLWLLARTVALLFDRRPGVAFPGSSLRGEVRHDLERGA